MRIGIHAGEKNARKLASYCNNVGVEDVCLSCSAVEGFEEKGVFEASALRALRRDLSEMGVDVRAMIAPTPSREALTGRPDSEGEVEKLCETIEAMGEAGVGTALWYSLNSVLNRPPTLVIGSGGRFTPETLDLSLRPGGSEWPALTRFIGRVVEAAEGAGVKLAHHLWDVELIDNLLGAVPSRCHGVTCCQGIYVLGGDPYAAVTHLGVDKIFLAHARNLARHGPRFLDYEEVFLDRGDVDIPRYMGLLKVIGYEGLIIPEHLGEGKGEDLIPDAVRYLKQLLCT